MQEVYHTWLATLKKHHPKEVASRCVNLAHLLVGIYRSGSVHLSHIARSMRGDAQQGSKIERLRRFLSNAKVDAGSWYEPYGRGVLEHLVACEAPIRLVIDGTKVGRGHQCLMVALAYRRRTIPLVWNWKMHKRGGSTVKEQRALLSKVNALLPTGAEVSLVGDGELGSAQVLKELEAWGWMYALRQSGRVCYQEAEASEPTSAWSTLRRLVSQGDTPRYHRILLSKTHAMATGLVTQWSANDPNPWILATNDPTPESCLKAYRLRMWIEEMFGDMKQHGFDLEASRLQHTERLDRLTLAVCLLYLWLLTFGAYVIKVGQRKLVDRTSRRDLSLFRIGWDMVERRLANLQSLTILPRPYV